jgi:hypothetical protein
MANQYTLAYTKLGLSVPKAVISHSFQTTEKQSISNNTKISTNDSVKHHKSADKFVIKAY